MVSQSFPTLDLTSALRLTCAWFTWARWKPLPNRHGLTAYLALAHSAALAQASFTLMVVGDTTGLKPPLSDLLRQPGVVCAGYVPDLATVLRPFDVSIFRIPTILATVPSCHCDGYAQ